MSLRIVNVVFGCLLISVGASAATISFDTVSGTTSVNTTVSQRYDVKTQLFGAYDSTYTGYVTAVSSSGNTTTNRLTLTTNADSTAYALTIGNAIPSSVNVTDVVLNLAIATAASVNSSVSTACKHVLTGLGCDLNPSLALTAAINSGTYVTVTSVTVDGTLYDFADVNITSGAGTSSLDLATLLSGASLANLLAAVQGGADIQVNYKTSTSSITLGSTDFSGNSGCANCLVVYNATGKATSTFTTANALVSYTAIPPVPTPEPASLAMIGAGLLALPPLLRRRRK